MYNAVRRLRDIGIATVAASGNDAWTNTVAMPACLSNVISVGSTNDDDRVSSFSNSSETLTMLAPGRSIRSAAVGGGSAFSSGTSMATPHVAGAIASLREAYPSATVAEMENAIVLSGLPVLDDRNGLTFPRLRADEARTLLASAASESPEPDPPAPESEGGDQGAVAAASPKGGGGGGSCGLVGIEPFLMLGLTRGMRRVSGMRRTTEMRRVSGMRRTRELRRVRGMCALSRLRA
jgi:subtilisin family serine protease